MKLLHWVLVWCFKGPHISMWRSSKGLVLDEDLVKHVLVCLALGLMVQKIFDFIKFSSRSGNKTFNLCIPMCLSLKYQSLALLMISFVAFDVRNRELSWLFDTSLVCFKWVRSRVAIFWLRCATFLNTYRPFLTLPRSHYFFLDWSCIKHAALFKNIVYADCDVSLCKDIRLNLNCGTWSTLNNLIPLGKILSPMVNIYPSTIRHNNHMLCVKCMLAIGEQ